VTIDGDLYGTLCFADTSPHPDGFTDTQRNFVELLTRWLGYELERHQAIEELTQERDRLDKFAQVISHDLRNPLTTAIGRVEFLKEDTENEHLRTTARALEKMEHFIDDLLALARDGREVEQTSRVQLAQTAHRSWEIVDIDGIGLQITADDATILADSGRLQQVFENLFQNASEHGETVSKIEVGLLDDGSGFYIADDGAGIPTEERERVFEPGYTTRENGTGFGLHIVQDIVTAHDWNVCVTSATIGGARFEISGVEFPDGSFPT